MPDSVEVARFVQNIGLWFMGLGSLVFLVFYTRLMNLRDPITKFLLGLNLGVVAIVATTTYSRFIDADSPWFEGLRAFIFFAVAGIMWYQILLLIIESWHRHQDEEENRDPRV